MCGLHVFEKKGNKIKLSCIDMYFATVYMYCIQLHWLYSYQVISQSWMFSIEKVAVNGCTRLNVLLLDY